MKTMRRIITLTTDFGTRDGFSGALKGVILGINPDATIVDISHEITPHDVAEGAIVFAVAAKYFPPDAIHVVVVDPGVGGARRALALQAGETFFVAPDNGVLSLAMTHPLRAVQLTKPEFWLPRVSSTFHGRDIFAPVAAHLSLGVSLDTLGEPVASIARLPFDAPAPDADGNISGRVIHVDRFGNLLTNIPSEMVERRDASRLTVEIAGQVIRGLKRTYGDGARGQVIALPSSSWLLEIAVREGSAAEKLNVSVGAILTVR